MRRPMRRRKALLTTTQECLSRFATCLRCAGLYLQHISVKVSFNSKVDEGLRIQQLSGGQKSLVALATGDYYPPYLFALVLFTTIQKKSFCHPEM